MLGEVMIGRVQSRQVQRIPVAAAGLRKALGG